MRRTPRTDRSRARQQRAGAAFVEALAATLLFSAILGLMFTLGRRYQTQLEATTRARQLAWNDTQPGCAPAHDGGLSAATGLASRTAGMAGALGAQLERAFGGAHGRPRLGRATDASPSADADTRTAETRTRFACNEALPQRDAPEASHVTLELLRDLIAGRSSR